MRDHTTALANLASNGFALVDDLYAASEMEDLAAAIEQIDQAKTTVRKSADVFAIRQLLKQAPPLAELVFNARLRALLEQAAGRDYFLVKSIYFDKPPASNWYVPYHQDLTISVAAKTKVPGFGPWTVKQNQFAVQPPLPLLENILTIRIHLDETDAQNGALRVVPASHLRGIYRPETIDWTAEKEVICPVVRGGAMLMKPLLLHSSHRTTNQQRRRVIHLEFASQELPASLIWAERQAAWPGQAAG